MSHILPFMMPTGEQKHITENYVSIPPALVITDEAGAIWTLGFKLGPISGGEYTFNVLRNGVDVGEYANRIERRKNEIWIYGLNGWKRMNVWKVETTYVYAIKASFREDSKIEPISVRIYWDSIISSMPIVMFACNSALGAVYNTEPAIICKPRQWLYAVINPVRFDILVTGYLGGTSLRVIPIREGDRT